MHQVRFGGMHGRKQAADTLQINSSDDEVTDDEELLTDPVWYNFLAHDGRAG
jgi:hypothetical protein